MDDINVVASGYSEYLFSDIYTGLLGSCVIRVNTRDFLKIENILDLLQSCQNRHQVRIADECELLLHDLDEQDLLGYVLISHLVDRIMDFSSIQPKHLESNVGPIRGISQKHAAEGVPSNSADANIWKQSLVDSRPPRRELIRHPPDVSSAALIGLRTEQELLVYRAKIAPDAASRESLEFLIGHCAVFPRRLTF